LFSSQPGRFSWYASGLQCFIWLHAPSSNREKKIVLWGHSQREIFCLILLLSNLGHIELSKQSTSKGLASDMGMKVVILFRELKLLCNTDVCYHEQVEHYIRSGSQNGYS
jgi:hypothetical protein